MQLLLLAIHTPGVELAGPGFMMVQGFPQFPKAPALPSKTLIEGCFDLEDPVLFHSFVFGDAENASRTSGA